MGSVAGLGPLMSTLKVSPWRSRTMPMTDSPAAGVYLLHIIHAHWASSRPISA